MTGMRDLALSRRDFLRLLLAGGSGLLASCIKSQPQASPAPIVQVTYRPTQTSVSRTRSKIDTVIILLQENHSFDSLFGAYPGANGQPAPVDCSTIFGTPAPEGPTSPFYNCTYPDTQIPNYWFLAQHFTLCDNYFSEVRGPSFPNYLMLTCAQSPMRGNPAPPVECPNYCLDLTSMANRLDEAHLTWHDYGGLFANIQSLQGRPEISFGKLSGFFEAASSGGLPNVTWIGAYLVGGTQASGHPPATICDGENFAVSIIDAAMHSPQWSSMLLVLIWDEWGGFYDHVPPPTVELSASGVPIRYGYRVPSLVISPFARAGYVSHTQYSHVSTLRTLESIFDLKPLTERDATANDLLGCLDFSQSPISPYSLFARDCSV